MVRPRHPGHPRPPNVSRGFTLVELLVVMAIIVLLLAATLPALRGPMGVSARRGAVNTLLGTLDQARALAISEGRSTYVVFPRPASASSSGSPATDKLARSYAVFADADDFAPPPAQRTAWLSLPTGIAFKVKEILDDNGNQISTLLNRPLEDRSPQFLIPSLDGNKPRLMAQPYVKFDPTGALDLQDSTYTRLMLFEGSIDPDTGAELPTRRAVGDLSSSTKQRPYWEEIQFNYVTGRARYMVDVNDVARPTSTPRPTP